MRTGTALLDEPGLGPPTAYDRLRDEITRRLTPAGAGLPDQEITDDDRERAAKAQGRLRLYLEAIWPIVEPGTPFVPGFHLDAMADHLEASYIGQIRNLLITMPPRFSKSLTASVAFPTWAWSRNAHLRFLTGSHDMGLSTEHAVLSRRVIESWWYQQHFGHQVRLTTDQNIKTHYENTARGYRIATSVGSDPMGKGGDFLLLDDPHNVKKRFSQKAREAVLDWFFRVWYTRLNDPKRGRRIVIMQRVHQQDLAAALIATGEYAHLCLPQEYDRKRTIVTPLGWKDRRTTPGQLLCPDRFGATENAGAKKSLGSDYTAGVKIAYAQADGRCFIEHVVHGQWGPGKADKMMLQTVQADGRSCRQKEEQEPGSAGKKVIAAHRTLFRGFDYGGEPSSGDKATRARPFRSQCEGGNVVLVQGEWNQAFLDELCAFPKGEYDDQVDAVALAFNELMTIAPASASMGSVGVDQVSGWTDGNV